MKKVDEMKKVSAIARMNGWACGFCKRMVKSPTLWVNNEDSEVGEGRCGVCGTELVFRRLKDVVKGPPDQPPIPPRLDPPLRASVDELRKPIEKVDASLCTPQPAITESIEGLFPTGVDDLETYWLNQGYKRFIFPKPREEGRPIVVDFLNKPLLLKWFEKYAEEKGLFLSEVVTGFAAKGVSLKLKEKKLPSREFVGAIKTFI